MKGPFLSRLRGRLATKGENVVAYRRATIRCRGAVTGAGTLHFGLEWNDGVFRESALVVHPDAAVEVAGRFRIYSGADITVDRGAKLSLGDGYINNHVYLSVSQELSIGRGVAIGPFARIIDSDRHHITGAKGPKSAPVRIGNNVWIGMGVTILKGVEIGDGAVVAAGSVVTKSIGPGELWAGAPARYLREVAWGEHLRESEDG